MELPPRLGPYRPLEHLGTGGMGEVYLARAPDGALLAVKTIRADLLDRPALRVRLRREAEALSRVRGDHLAELVAHDLESDPPYLATRYIQGRSLRDVVAADGPLPSVVLWRLADVLARALASVHEAGYLHRDLKPANVMMVDDSPVVIDFGISHALDETRLSRHGRASGTPAYMAPELVAEGRAEPAGDVYSWAATVTHAATGRDAQWSALSPAALARILFSAEDLSSELRDLLDAAFAPDPAARPTADDLVARLAPLAPAPGADIHLDHPHVPGTTSVALTLPGGRRTVLTLPSDAGPGETLGFPHRGHPGRHGGPPGTLHLHLVSPERNRSEAVATSIRPRKRRLQRASLYIPVLLIVGSGLLAAFSIWSAGEVDKRKESPGLSASGQLPRVYSSIPESCRLLSAADVEWFGVGEETAFSQNAPRPSAFGEVDSCTIMGAVGGFPGRLDVEVTLVGEDVGKEGARRSGQAFRERRRLVERNPYSREGYRKFALGEEAFSYVRVVNDESLVGAEVLVDNVIVNVRVSQDLEAAEDPKKPEAVRGRLQELAEKVISTLLGQAITSAIESPGP